MIATDIPIPAKGNTENRRGELRRMIDSMEVGHSILCRNRVQVTYCRNIMTKYGWKATERTQPDRTIRIWRIS
jgi:hypothetical protein